MSNNESDSATAQSSVQTNESDPGAATVPVSERRQRLSALAQQLAQVAQRKRALLAKVETTSRAQQAAQGEAMKARQQWSAKLRDSDGTLTREIQKLRAAERSALSLAEEYQAMECEIATELPRLELELAVVADSCIKGKQDIAKEVAGQAYEQLMTQAGDCLATAFTLFTMAENAGVGRRQAADADELASRFFHRLGGEVRRRLGDAAVTDQVAQQLALPPMDLSGVDLQLVQSPTARHVLRRQIDGGHTA